MALDFRTPSSSVMTGPPSGEVGRRSATPLHGASTAQAAVEEALVIMSRAPKERKATLKASLDASRTAEGTVTRYEFRRALDTSDIQLTFKMCSQLMDWLCEPGQGRERVGVDEFWRRIYRLEAFERADANHDGVLSRMEAVSAGRHVHPADQAREGRRTDAATPALGAQPSAAPSALRCAVSDVASAPVPAQGLTALEELHMKRKPSLFTPSSDRVVNSFLSRYTLSSSSSAALILK